MKIGIIGRTKILLNTAKFLHDKGFDISFIYTCKAESFYHCDSIQFKQFAEKINAQFYDDLKINTEDRVQLISSYNCDIAISMNWLNILKSPICHAFKHGIWNVHAGDLPRYRGNACPNWAILNNEKEIGLSIHEMVPNELDSGDIISKEFYLLTENTYISDVYNWIDKIIPTLFFKALNQLKDGTLHKIKQSTDSANILRCYPRKPQDSKILWSEPVKKIYALIRASSHPFSGAFCFLEDGQRIIIWEAEPFDHKSPFCAVPGQVLFHVNSDPVIACLDGTLKIKKASTEDEINAKPLILSSLRNRLI